MLIFKISERVKGVRTKITLDRIVNFALSVANIFGSYTRERKTKKYAEEYALGEIAGASELSREEGR